MHTKLTEFAYKNHPKASVLQILLLQPPLFEKDKDTTACYNLP